MKPIVELSSPRKRQALNRPVTGTLLTLLAVSTVICTTSCKKAAPAAPPPPVVQVIEFTATNVPLHAEFIGQLDSPQNVEVRARVEAFVDQMLFIEGSEVKQGDQLFKLDDKPNQERLAAANGMLAEAKAALNEYRRMSPASPHLPRSVPFPNRTSTTPSPRWTWARQACSRLRRAWSRPKLTWAIATYRHSISRLIRARRSVHR